MKVKNACIPCMTKSLVKLAEKVTSDKKLQEDIINYGLAELSNKPFEKSSPWITARIYDYAKKASGVADPYLHEKRSFNQIAQRLIHKHKLQDAVENSIDPLETAVRLSIAGNIIDFSLGYDVEEEGVETSINQSLNADLFGMSMALFKEDIEKANKIMIIADNSGEIVFDKLLIKQLPLEKIVYAVKKGAIVNDANMDDAIETGMVDLVRVIDNGTSIQGTVYEACSQSFKEEFDTADLVISKGQANFETLESHKDKPIYYLLRAKCQIVADQVGCPKGAYVFLKS